MKELYFKRKCTLTGEGSNHVPNGVVSSHGADPSRSNNVTGQTLLGDENEVEEEEITEMYIEDEGEIK